MAEFAKGRDPQLTQIKSVVFTFTGPQGLIEGGSN